MTDCKQIYCSIDFTKNEIIALKKELVYDYTKAVYLTVKDKQCLIEIRKQIELSDKSHKIHDTQIIFMYLLKTVESNDNFMLQMTDADDFNNFKAALTLMNVKLPFKLKGYANNASEWTNKQCIRNQCWSFYQQNGKEYSMYGKKTWEISSHWFGSMEADEFFYRIKTDMFNIKSIPDRIAQVDHEKLVVKESLNPIIDSEPIPAESN